MLSYTSLCFQVFICLAIFLNILIGTSVSLIVLGIRERQSEIEMFFGFVFFLSLLYASK